MDKAMHSEFEGHTPKTIYQLLEENHASPDMLYKMHAPDGIHLSHGERIEKAMREFAEQENQSLRSELQKQKELNAELVEAGVQLLRYDSSMKYVMREKLQHHEIFIEVLEKFESLIKKSMES